MRLYGLSLPFLMAFLTLFFAGGEGRSLRPLQKIAAEITGGKQGRPLSSIPKAPSPPSSKYRRPPGLKYSPPPGTNAMSLSDELAHLRALKKKQAAGWFSKGDSTLRPSDIVRMQNQQGVASDLRRGAYKIKNWMLGDNDARAYEVPRADRSHLRRTKRERQQPQQQQPLRPQKQARSWYSSFF